MKKAMSDQMVFGLDIGTRSVVGIVGMKSGERFVVMGQSIREHQTRSMLDGQIHDIGAVSATIKEVKEELEEGLGFDLSRACIAAAGRVLRTMQHTVEITFPQEKTITEEDITTLDMMGTSQAYDRFQKEHSQEEKFYCVGYSVIHYYMDGNIISNLLNHKATSIKEDLIATFLPYDVVDGLNKAVELSGLEVASMTLEPIAAIEVAIPVSYRMLNLALVDVGAGTSDICITRDGTIAAYGMIPIAGDVLTEDLTQHCLVDFNTAEYIKKEAEKSGSATYKDIMGLEQTITEDEILNVLEKRVDEMTDKVASKILELNGDKPVSAVFVVGGGGRIPGYTKKLSEKLNINNQRVAIRGEDVMTKVEFPAGMRKDSLMVTPVGICLNYYEQANNFIVVSFNNKQVKLYDNSHLVIADAAITAEFDNRDLFPKRGRELNFTVNGSRRIVRGEPGDAAEITLNGEPADVHTEIHGKDVIVVKPSTAGEKARLMLSELPEMKSTLKIIVMGAMVTVPAALHVNGVLESPDYEIKENDDVTVCEYYLLGDLLKYLDISVKSGTIVMVNNEEATNDTKVYSNFSVAFKEPVSQEQGPQESSKATEKDSANAENPVVPTQEPHSIFVTVNGKVMELKGKPSYVFVDVFEVLDFDLTAGNGREIITLHNKAKAEYMDALHDGDILDIYWKE